jgi:hemolysin III
MKKLREPVNGLTHFAGAAGGCLALVALVWGAADAGKPKQAVGFAVFGLSLIALYLASALYHSLPLPPVGVSRLRRLDHMMIYVLIAGTYTPICLVALEGRWSWGMLALVWGLALVGLVFKTFWMHAPGWISMALYMGMGWAAVIAAPALLRALPGGAVAWIVAGGLVYTAGTVVLGLRRPNPIPGVFGPHEIWHLFVLGGSACHVWVMARYIAPL